MEKSTKWPLLPRYSFCWCWRVQFRVIKPKKIKKEWIDVTEVMGEDEADALKAINRLCSVQGWKLIEVYFMEPTQLAYSYDRDAPADEFLTHAQQRQLFPRPATYGKFFRPKTSAELAQERENEKRMKALRTDFPLLAETIIATEFPARP